MLIEDAEEEEEENMTYTPMREMVEEEKKTKEKIKYDINDMTIKELEKLLLETEQNTRYQDVAIEESMKEETEEIKSHDKQIKYVTEQSECTCAKEKEKLEEKYKELEVLYEETYRDLRDMDIWIGEIVEGLKEELRLKKQEWEVE